MPNKKLVAKEDAAAWVNRAFQGDTNAGPGGCSDGGRAKSGSGLGEHSLWSWMARGSACALLESVRPPTGIFDCVDILDKSFPCSCVRPATCGMKYVPYVFFCFAPAWVKKWNPTFTFTFARPSRDSGPVKDTGWQNFTNQSGLGRNVHKILSVGGSS